ncbi:MAG: type II secretion system protein, partial [Akkermansiaceae bacterium]|nr:type II secretion system protein [Armatimonadota bacterium]
MPLSHHHSKRGFTLTELTVVVLIVFVLGAILFPVFAKRRGGRHRQFSCASNQKQIALGFLQYIQDYDQCFPPPGQYVDLRLLSNKPKAPPYVVIQSWGPDRKLTDGRIIPGLISPYFKSNRVFFDPNREVPSGDRYATNYDPNVFALFYMYNDLLSGIDQ